MDEATLITTGTKPVLCFERFLPRPVEQVWRAVTDPAELRAWYPTRIEIDRWEPGATLTHHFDDHPSLDPIPGTELEYAEPHRLVFTWARTPPGSSCRPSRGARRSC